MGSGADRVPRCSGLGHSFLFTGFLVMDNYDPPLTIRQTRMLAAVIKTTRRMLEAAKKGSWASVAELEALRRDDLKSCFAIPMEGGNGELMAETLAVLLHLNEELMSLLKTARLQARTDINDLASAGEYKKMQAIK